MPNYLTENPVDAANVIRESRRTMANQNALTEEQGFQVRYNAEAARGVDKAIRSGLAGYSMPPAKSNTTLSKFSAGPVATPSALPSSARTPEINPAANNPVMQNLINTPGGGAKALSMYTANRTQAAASDAEEKKAVMGALRSGDPIRMRSVFRALGREVPQWALNASQRMAGIAAIEYADKAGHRGEKAKKYIHAYLGGMGVKPTQQQEQAFASIPAAAPVNAGIQKTAGGLVGVTYAPGSGYSAAPINDAAGKPLMPNDPSEPRNIQRSLETAMDMNTSKGRDGSDVVDWAGVSRTIRALETGAPLSSIAGDRAAAQAARGPRVSELKALELAAKVTETMAGVWSLDGSDFAVTGGDREKFNSLMEDAIRAGNRNAAYQLIGENADARNILDAHFGAQTQPETLRAMTTPPNPGPSAFPDARQAKDGFWYVVRNGKYYRIDGLPRTPLAGTMDPAAHDRSKPGVR